MDAGTSYGCSDAEGSEAHCGIMQVTAVTVGIGYEAGLVYKRRMPGAERKFISSKHLIPSHHIFNNTSNPNHQTPIHSHEVHNHHHRRLCRGPRLRCSRLPGTHHSHRRRSRQLDLTLPPPRPQQRLPHHGAPSQNSTCPDPSVNYATFTLTQDTGDLYLYTDNPPHQAVVDRSGMGQGHIGYTTGVQPIGKNQERGPFKINEDGDVVFAATNGAVGFQACPGALGGGYSVWLTGVTEPAGNQGCVGFVAKALREDEPQKCLYTVYE
jgi:hypothetical protein